ncbi:MULTISPECIES: GlxA family transcriptional regulator [unclassified Burkholderia]|uniref:GlxA family transcriptional regulator n=1 Tax=unclassified Burkholderia TaxID=2613784 RepID=UPI000F5766AC|nr:MULTISPECIES: helix-turn-helix domain-containing protein [unclassified Burkholderia]RQR42071.1 helix-turn-helix domain-containing protein [Burkholderia sp. Bp9142]RQR56463.1 helix-turn-helix domain-containing protein [Burkholderia sp. Bp9140]
MPLIRIWAVDHALASGIAAPTDILTAANHLAPSSRAGHPHTPFRWRIESIDGKPVRTASGQSVPVDGTIDGSSGADAIWLTAPFVADIERLLARPTRLAPLLGALRRQHARGTLIATYCTGAFLLAEAGLLDGRAATTHWSKAARFQARYPDVALRASDVLTEQDGILCGGAITSYQNLALRIVDRLANARLAASVAKLMLIDLQRVSQDSFVDFAQLEHPGHDDPVVARALRWMERHLREPFSLARLGAHVALSERTLHRRFKDAVGTPPLRYLQTLRIEVAKKLLAETKLGIDAVCERVGYTDLSGFRQLFKRETGIAPGEYRRRFTR